MRRAGLPIASGPGRGVCRRRRGRWPVGDEDRGAGEEPATQRAPLPPDLLVPVRPRWLHDVAQDGYRATQAVGVAVGPRNTYEPDVLLHRAEGSGDRHYLTPDEVLLVVEVVSPATRRRDRFDKPAGYAAVGISHYWRVEQDPVRIYAYRLGDRPGASGEREYALVAQTADLLELDAPFPVKLPISEITP